MTTALAFHGKSHRPFDSLSLAVSQTHKKTTLLTEKHDPSHLHLRKVGPREGPASNCGRKRSAFWEREGKRGKKNNSNLWKPVTAEALRPPQIVYLSELDSAGDSLLLFPLLFDDLLRLESCVSDGALEVGDRSQRGVRRWEEAVDYSIICA